MQILEFGLILWRGFLAVIVHFHVMFLDVLYYFVCLFEFGLCLVEKSHNFETFLTILISLLSEEEDWVLDDKEEGHSQ
jgi:hypothetical protein